MLNKVILIGNVGKDPEIRALGNGNEVANLSVATSETWKDKQTGEKKEKTEWHNISVFNKGLIDVIKNYVHKGSKLYLEGQLQTRSYEKEGQTHYSTEVVLQGYNGTLQMLDSPKEKGHADRVQEQRSQSASLDQDVPF